MKNGYKKTVNACFVGYIVQAIINNFLPLLFLTFQRQYDIRLSQITALITINFFLQLFVDLASAVFVDKIGYRTSAVLAHIFSATGLVLLTVLPDLLGNAFAGILISVVVYAVGGGLLEVLISPIVEACPTDNKEKAMSLLHSFYCWGCVAVIGLSTLFFNIFSTDAWKVLALLWAVIPLCNAFVFSKVPIAPLVEDEKNAKSIKQIFSSKVFWVMCLLMVCAGASEQAVSQWASAFAESGLNVSKTVGDLAGPMMFAVFMGSARLFYGKFGHKINLKKFMVLSSVLCCVSYCIIGFSQNAFLGFLGCALCGLSVGIMWPGTFSISASILKGGGTAMFAFLALAGDLGCMLGPSLVGFSSARIDDNLKLGIATAIVFPALMCIVLISMKKLLKNRKNSI